MLLGAGGNNIFGTVVEPSGYPTLQRGGFSLILIKNAPFGAVYEQVDWDISEQQFIDGGYALGGPELAVPAGGTVHRPPSAFTSALRASIGSPDAPKAAPTNRGASKLALQDCASSLTTPFASVTITPPNIQVLPLFIPKVKYDNSGHQQLDVTFGISVNANAGISGVLQPTVSLSGDCLLGKFARVNVAAAFLGPLAALLDFYGEAELKLGNTLTATGGPEG